ncbi:response regulator [Oryzihumus leptocrescens]|uniref:Response regulator receiver domain-containing protein n=1 Tax=Oryzihumus leptocrescens TaxID=297536 RepID=A0A542ZGZ0_9MICO|nr:response regulator [Oryzihumus leptocrescens]TQL59586.1 response regulator receiver domain-containing protein [Oryzihumus leptocrescens]
MKRVLVVDDDDIILEVAQMSLEAVAGWEVITASSGAEAVATARAEVPDAIVMDVMMPEMDGPTACRLLAADELTRGIPIVLLTAKVQQSEQRQWASLPVAGVLAKPFDPMRLAGQVAELVGWSLT